MSLFTHTPHPHIEARKALAPRPRRPVTHPLARFSASLGVLITNAVGTMSCAGVFACIAFISLPDAIHGGTAATVSWIAQTFLQLVLLSIIMVVQKVEGAAADKRAADTYADAEAILHESLALQQHLQAQDVVLTEQSTILLKIIEAQKGEQAA